MDLPSRLTKTIDLLKQERDRVLLQEEIKEEVEEQVGTEVQERVEKNKLLEEQMKHIQKELGEKNVHAGKDTQVDKWREALKGKTVPEDVMKTINSEIDKFQSLQSSSPEYNVSRSYLDWLTCLPWGVTSKENFDVVSAKEILERDHYGLDDIKTRILEFIAIGNLRGTVQGKILCFVGPPGVGKTSIGKSIAASLHREFFRFSVGGLTDVAEIKGHRRTYVGAMPGKIVQSLKRCQTENPLILIDEVDKIGRGSRGDPTSALLELLDPSQNNSFVDHYLDMPMDLSKTLFVCTANTLDTIPGPLLDRMEVIRIAGYDEPEKLQIALKYLIPKSFESAGVENCTIEHEAVKKLIRQYCRESGVRNLEKKIEKVARKVAFERVSAHSEKKANEPEPEIPPTEPEPTPEPETEQRNLDPSPADMSKWKVKQSKRLQRHGKKPGDYLSNNDKSDEDPDPPLDPIAALVQGEKEKAARGESAAQILTTEAVSSTSEDDPTTRPKTEAELEEEKNEKFLEEEITRLAEVLKANNPPAESESQEPSPEPEKQAAKEPEKPKEVIDQPHTTVTLEHIEDYVGKPVFSGEDIYGNQPPA